MVGFLLIQVCLWAGRTKSNVRAKWLMHATVLHLPLLLGLMMYDKFPRFVIAHGKGIASNDDCKGISGVVVVGSPC